MLEANFVTMLKVSVHAALNAGNSISHCSECDDKKFSDSKELKDQLISSPILRLWQSGSRMMYNSSGREDDDIGVSIILCVLIDNTKPTFTHAAFRIFAYPNRIWTSY